MNVRGIKIVCLLPPSHEASIFAILLRQGYEETSYDGQDGGPGAAMRGKVVFSLWKPRRAGCCFLAEN